MGELRTAGFGAARGLARPQNTIEAVAELFDLQGLTAGRSERTRSGAL